MNPHTHRHHPDRHHPDRPHRHQTVRGRDLVTRLFAAALEDDPVADEALRRLAPHDPGAAAAFEAIVVTETERRAREAPTGHAPLHVVDQIMAAVNDPTRNPDTRH